MKHIRVTLLSSAVALLFLPLLASAQNNDGTIEASWGRATSKPAPVERRVVPPPKPIENPRGMEYTNTSWGAERDGTSRPWPKLSASSTANEYYEANAAVIDSLTQLYCVSSNYISTLRIRNQQAMQGREPAMRDFSYEDGQNTVPAKSARSSLDALHKELLQLLERCLIGR